MARTLMAVAASPEKDTPLTKLLKDVLSMYSSYLMDDVSYPIIMDHIHTLDTPALPFNADRVFEHMYRLREDMIDERNK